MFAEMFNNVLWCGRVVSGEGVKHDPARIDALKGFPLPSLGNELQHTELDAQLATSLQQTFSLAGVADGRSIYKRAGGRKKNMMKNILFSEVGWSQEEIDCFERCKSALGNALQLAHPDPAKRLCVFTDASEDHWGAVMTQMPQDQQLRPLSEQDHAPQMMLSGTFSGSAKLERKAFAIVETCRRADYLLHRADGFALSQIAETSATFLSSRGQVHWWSLLLMAYRYDIYDIAGEENVWADLLSRWGCSFKSVCTIRQIALPMSPQLDKSFSKATPPSGITRHIDHALWKDGKGRIWIPDEDADLQVRIPVVSHFGVTGRRALAPTLQKIGERFTWNDMKSDMEVFVSRCLHCASALGGPPQSRVLGEVMHADSQNELIHWDYLFIEESTTGVVYVLFIKDDASKYVWLLPCKSVDAEATEGHVVGTQLEARYNTKKKPYEIKVHWRCLDTIENSWEPVDVLLQDVPVAVKAFARKKHSKKAVKALSKAFNLR
ncbi:Hypothetical protein PHPALM_17552 [Phytophthora palmivora]|uniref:Reverse transcriptase/retrotransposon-derived protein RNase H-like domain-containing protein n=1 Tax=Phytophthora palmivora TaxID=4796 RepID=A0A2P4XLY1_9STRA|nr:Hypothetical protein PHPALM_17552 [Phytophthora palmivora]